MTTLTPGGFGTPTTDDSRPWLWVASIVACAYSVLTLAARIMSKIEMLSYEDGILGVAYVFGLAHWGLFNRATYLGFGTQEGTTGDESQLLHSSQVLLICAIYLSKISVLWFGRRLFTLARPRREKTFDVTISLTAACGIVSVVLLSARCNSRHALGAPQEQCPNLRARWIVIQVLDTLTELGVVALPSSYIWQNRLSLSSKLNVIFLFALRLPCIVFAALAATEYRRNAGSVADQSAVYDLAAVWSEVLLGYSLSSASFPCIRTFLLAFLANSMYHVPGDTTGSQANRSRSGVSVSKAATLGNVSAAEAGMFTSDDRLSGEAISGGSEVSQGGSVEGSAEIEVLGEAELPDVASRRDPRNGRDRTVFPARA